MKPKNPDLVGEHPNEETLIIAIILPLPVSFLQALPVTQSSNEGIQ